MFKKILIVLISIISINSDIKASQLVLTGTHTMGSDEDYSSNTAGSGVVATGVSVINANNYILTTGLNGSDGIYVDTGSQLTINNAFIVTNQNDNHGIYNYGDMTINGAINGTNTLEASDNTSFGIYSYGDMTIKNMSITTNENEKGIVNDENTITILGIADGSNSIEANNNYIAGILNSGTLNIENMSITANENEYGIANYGDTITILGIVGGSNSIETNGNFDSGISNTIGTLDIKNMSITANENDMHGIHNYDNMIITGIANGNNTVETNNNVRFGISNEGTSTIKNTSIVANENAIGIDNRDTMTITGIANGSGTIETSNNNYAGISNSGSSLIVENMSITANENTDGISNAGTITLTGINDGTNTLETNDNLGKGVSNTGTLNVNNMSIFTDRNTNGGLENFGNMVVTGVTDGTNIIESNNNGGKGIYNTDILTVNNMSIATNENVDGIHNRGNMTVIGIADASTTLESNDNSSMGIINDSGTLTIKNTSIQTNENALYGIMNYSNSTIAITGVANGTNTMEANNNGISGIYSSGTLDIKNTSITADGNSSSGITNYGDLMTFVGVLDGSNTIEANNNISTSGIWNNTGTVIIENMSITTNENYSGIANYGDMTITGIIGGTNTIETSRNQEKGIYSKGTLTVNNMSIMASENGWDGIYNDSVITVNGIADGTNTIDVNNNGVAGISNVGNMTIDNISITANENGWDGIYNASNIIITGTADGANAIEANNNGGAGVYNAYSAAIYDMSITANENVWGGIYNEGAMTISGVSASTRNTLSLHDNTDYGINLAFNDASINLANLDVDVSGNNFVHFADGSILTADNTVIEISDASTGIVTDTNANITMTDSTLTTSGKLIDTLGAGVVDLQSTNSTLSGYISPSPVGTINFDFTDSTWNTLQTSELNKINANNSHIDIRGTGFNTLTMNEFSGSGNTIYLNTELGDDTSATDQLVVNSSLSGSAVLDVTALSGNGLLTHNGIKLVNAENTSIDSGIFTLNGGMVDTGGYEYYLFKGDVDGLDEKSWFLRTTYNPTNTARSIGQEPALLVNMMKTGMNTLNKRMGELRDGNNEHKDGIWIRSYAKNLHIDDFADINVNLYGVEGGYDKKVYADCDDVVFAGVMAGYMTSENIKMHQTNGYNGNGNGSMPSVGLYATWLNKDGWFADATMRTFWEDLNMTNFTATGTPVSYEPDRQITALSLEFGKQLAWQADKYSKYILEPKLETMYSWADGKTVHTNIGNDIRYGNSESFTAKAVVMAGYNTALENGIILEPYAQIGIINEFMGITNVRYDNANMKSDLHGISLEYGAGVNAQIDSNISVYGEALYEKGEIIEAISGNIGLRYSW